MKLLISLALAFGLQVNAATVTVIADSSDAKYADLMDVPQTLTGIMIDQGFKFKKEDGDKYTVTVKNLHCDYRHRAAYEGPIGGVPTEVCRYNSQNVKDTTKGRLLADGRKFAELIGRVDSAGLSNEATFTDCAMGYCGTFVKVLKCTVDNSIEDYGAGRFSCQLTDGN